MYIHTYVYIYIYTCIYVYMYICPPCWEGAPSDPWVALLVQRYVSNTASFALCVFVVSRIIIICHIIRHLFEENLC